jgi:predicted RNA-binding protein with PIN domain
VSDGGPPTSATRQTSPLPETLLVPLLDTAADLMRELELPDVPPSLRPLAGFDRRGLARGAARQQLLRAIKTDEAFRNRAIERFNERPEVAAALEAWEPGETLGIVAEAAERADLPLLASTLYAARPPGWEFGLGVVCATSERERTHQQASEEHKARETQLAGMAESRRRADAACSLAEQRVEVLEEELREERAGRRARETQADQVVGAAERQVEQVERDLMNARTALEAAEARLRREADRARDAEAQLRELRRDPGAARKTQKGGDSDAGPGRAVLRGEDLQVLVDAADLARRLADGLTGVAEQARRVVSPQQQTEAAREVAPPEQGQRERTARRAQARVPPGMVEDAPDVLEAMLRTPRAVLVVDGYNVSMLAWGDTPPAEQRERLLAAISELQLRTRARTIVVFDGADVEGVQPPRRSGVRVVFSPAEEEADAVVLREAAALPLDIPVIVASSDNWVAENARKADARVVSSETLLRALRR